MGDPGLRRRVNRLRTSVLVLTIVIVFGAIAGPTLVIFYTQQVSADQQLAVACEVLKAEVHQLAAIQRNGILLEEIARQLGLPIVPPPSIVIPEVPAECHES